MFKLKLLTLAFAKAYAHKGPCEMNNLLQNISGDLNFGLEL